MGSDPEKDVHASEKEQPLHEVHLKVYEMSFYPVTNSQYQSFVEDDGYSLKWRHCWTDEGWTWKEHENITGPYSFGGEFDVSNHLIVGVSWHEAIAFCNWLTSRWRKIEFLSDEEIVRLPTEAEWEYAARSQDNRLYPWGNDIDIEHANYIETGLGLTSPVGCFFKGKSPYNCEEMAGNVWEWCQNVWHDNYKNAPTDGSAWESDRDNFRRVFRGGGWSSSAEDVRVTSRYGGSPHSRLHYLGFRVVRAIS